MVVFLLIVFLTVAIAYGSNVANWLIGALFFIGLTGTLVGINLFTNKRDGAVRIVPRKQNEARGLSHETRKQLFIGLSCAIIGGLAGLWAGFFH